MQQQVFARPTHELAHALMGALEVRIGMTADDAREIASFVAGAFNGKPEVDDITLSPDLRSIFYTLEGHRLLSFRREECLNEEGQVRRAFFWHVRWENVNARPNLNGPVAQQDSVYDELPVTAWRRAAS